MIEISRTTMVMILTWNVENLYWLIKLRTPGYVIMQTFLTFFIQFTIFTGKCFQVSLPNATTLYLDTSCNFYLNVLERNLFSKWDFARSEISTWRTEKTLGHMHITPMTSCRHVSRKELGLRALVLLIENLARYVFQTSNAKRTKITQLKNWSIFCHKLLIFRKEKEVAHFHDMVIWLQLP